MIAGDQLASLWGFSSMLANLPPFMGQRLYELRSAHRLAGLDARHFMQVDAKLRAHFGSLDGLRMLDLGHGSRFNQLLLFHSRGVQIAGLDMERFPLRSPSAWGRMCQRVYYGLLQSYTAVRLQFRGLQVIQGDAQQLPLADQSLDCVISNAVFEHLPDVAQVLREVRRVLAPGGVAHIGLHLWTSPSGSHHPAIVDYPLRAERWPRELVPWFHLRELPPYDLRHAPTYGYQRQYLNRNREHDYRQAFEAALEVVEWQRFYREGEVLIQPEVLAALPDYSTDELTTRSLRVLARRP